MKNVYIVLSATPTLMGKIIRIFTRSLYNHSSISLTEDWSEMYSFARYRRLNPLVGGFVKEFPERLSLGKERNVFIKVFKIPVNDCQYEEIKKFIYEIRDAEEENIYNTAAVLTILFKIKININNAYTCADFVAESLFRGDIISRNQVSRDILPDEIQKMLDKHIYFHGCLNNYEPVKEIIFDSKDFFEKTKIVKEIPRTYYHFKSLVKKIGSSSTSNITGITKNQ